MLVGGGWIKIQALGRGLDPLFSLAQAVETCSAHQLTLHFFLSCVGIFRDEETKMCLDSYY